MKHCQETRIQVVTGQEFYGRSLVEHLDTLEFLKPQTSLIHATWLSDRDIEVIARSGASVQYNPWSNAIMGSGVAPVRVCLDAGINVSIGTDGCGLLHGVSMLNAMGTGAVLPKITGPDPQQWLTAAEIFRAASEGGAHAFGLQDRIGRIEKVWWVTWPAIRWIQPLLRSCSAVLARIERFNPEFKAFVRVYAERAQCAARASEARWGRKSPLGPLDGVPISIKDLILTKGFPTLRGSLTVDENQP